uniref:Reverse transcriptase domain-containing protein n=1 Tax=Oreochromis niloticus TaxID=8128 RepID=A0A669AWP5_ORENI
MTSLNDYRAVALTPVVINALRSWSTDASQQPSCSLDPHQFAYRANRSTEDTVATALHAAVSHLEEHGSYVGMVFVDYCSAFNTILPHKLVVKLQHLGLPYSTCMWINSFLQGRRQSVRVGHRTSSALSFTHRAVGSVHCSTLSTHTCPPEHTFVKFADDTTVMGLISRGDESAYRDEEQLSSWCKANNLLLNTSKTKELTIAFRRKKAEIQPLFINGDCVERVASFHFLGVNIEENLSWSVNTSELLKKAQQRLYFLRILRWNNITQRLLVSFYRASIESVLTYCICIWYTSCTVAQRKALQGVINTAQKITGCPLPMLEDLHNTRCLKKAQNIIKDTSHPGHSLFELLPSGRRYRAISVRTNRLKHSFYQTAITRLNAATKKCPSCHS